MQSNEVTISVFPQINRVEGFVSKINTTLRIRHEQNKMQDVVDRLDMYCPVEAVNDEVERVRRFLYLFILKNCFASMLISYCLITCLADNTYQMLHQYHRILAVRDIQGERACEF